MSLNKLADKYHQFSTAGKNTSRIADNVIRKATPYIKKIIHRLDTPSGIAYSQQDLEQTAMLMVVKALQNYDSSLESKFSTYMYLRVRGGLISYMRKHDTLTRTQRNRAGKVSKAVHELSQTLGREPCPEEIADHIGHETSDVRRYIRQLNSRNRDGDFDDVTIEADFNVEKAFNQSRLRGVLMTKLKKLDVRSRVILILVFYHDLTTKQIGKIVGIHNQYVSTLKQRALKKLSQ